MKREDFEKAKKLQERIEEFKKFRRAMYRNRLCLPIVYDMSDKTQVYFYPNEEDHNQTERFKDLIDSFIEEYEQDLIMLGIE